MRRKRFALLVSVPAVALAGAALWKHEKLVTAYWEYRLVWEVDSLASYLVVEPSPRQEEAIRAFVRRPSGCKQLVDGVLAQFSGTCIHCEGEGPLHRALLSIRRNGRIELDVLCGKTHIFGDYKRPDDPLLRLGRMLEAAVNMDTETDSYAVSILPRPDAIERFARDLGIHKDKLPEAKGRETEATIFMIRREAERPAPEARERGR